MSNFPTSLDNDTSLPYVSDDDASLNADNINKIRDAVLAIEETLGSNVNGTAINVATRLNVCLNADGTIKPSVITSLGLVSLPIENVHISPTAQIQESKLSLDHKTSDLYNYILNISDDINVAKGWISTEGVKLQPHIMGALFRHSAFHLDVDPDTNNYFLNKFNEVRDNTNLYTALKDMNDELTLHHQLDGYGVSTDLITTQSGLTYPSNFAHLASGINLNSGGFSFIPQSIQDLQSLVNYIDNSSIFLYGTRIQTLYTNGISRTSRSSVFLKDGYGQELINSVDATCFLALNGTLGVPYDDIDQGDDLVELKPSGTQLTSNIFDAKFNLVKVGDIARINYDGVEIYSIIKEIKYINDGSNKRFVIRINGKNLKYTTTAKVSISKSLVNSDKQHVLALSIANNKFNTLPSLIVNSPKGASTLGLGFNHHDIDEKHYMLYLALYPTGNPSDGYTLLPGIDVTGDAGASKGSYTLSKIVEETNNAIRKSGYNLRFNAFSYEGEFGIALADSYNGSAFSIISGVIANNGVFNKAATQSAFPNNIIDLFPTASKDGQDALGFGPLHSNIASPPYLSTYSTYIQAKYPTKLICPLRSKNYYVDGVEKDSLAYDIEQELDGYGNGYWSATIVAKSIIPAFGGNPGRVELTYRVGQYLLASQLKEGKTLVVQKATNGNLVNFGRFLISSINATCDVNNNYTDITVYDAVHAIGTSPSTVLDIGETVKLYFSYDSVGFNIESTTDYSEVANFKRHFEVYVDKEGKTFSHERARMCINGSPLTINEGVILNNTSNTSYLNFVKISPKLQGYSFGSINKITLKITASISSAYYNGYLCHFDGINYTKIGPVAFGKIGDVVRFYDQSGVDYIDVVYEASGTLGTFNDNVDFQLFPSLEKNQELFLLGTCQVNTSLNIVDHLIDRREFGNTSEKDLSKSALDLISLGEKYLHENGILNGFDLAAPKAGSTNPNDNQIYINGGIALVNGKFINMNPFTVTVPTLKEVYGVTEYNINWFLCVNDVAEPELVLMKDYDSSNSNVNAPDRNQVVVKNLYNNEVYPIKSSKFEYLMNNIPDKKLTPLYILSTSITNIIDGYATSIGVKDCRKFASNNDSIHLLKYTSTDSFGNFKSLDSILNHLLYNSKSISDVDVSNSDNQIVSQIAQLNFKNKVTFDGKGIGSIVFSKKVVIGSNFEFKNCELTFGQDIIEVLGQASNITFTNCKINITTPSSHATSYIFRFNGSNKITFKKCTFVINFSKTLTPGDQRNVFQFDNTNNIDFEDNDFDLSFGTINNSVFSGNLIYLFIINNFKFINNNITGSYRNLINVDRVTDFTVKNNKITNTYNPVTISDSGYNSSLNSNTKVGTIFFDGGNLNESLLISDNEFIYSPAVTTSQRFDFIRMELVATGTVYRNCLIENNKFFSTNAGSGNDFKAAISIVNECSATAGTNEQTSISNFIIRNNYCNRDQLILLTSKRDGTGNMVSPGLVTYNTEISNNICGAIGYFISKPSKQVTNTTNMRDKDPLLNITGNNTRIIAPMDSEGKYFLANNLVSSVLKSRCAYQLGNISITKNNASWIHGTTNFNEDNVSICNNNLTAYDTFFKNNFGMTGADNTVTDVDGFGGSHHYPIFVNATRHYNLVPGSVIKGNNANVTIKDNTFSPDRRYNGTTPYNNLFFFGYIFTQSSANITGNICKGVDETQNEGKLIKFGGLNTVIQNNSLYRDDKSIESYIAFEYNYDDGWNYYDSSAIITHNYFDSPYIDLSNSNENTIYQQQYNHKWIVKENINQTGFVYLPIINGKLTYNNTLTRYVAESDTNYFIGFANSSSGQSNVTRIFDNYTPATERRYMSRTNLESILPHNVRPITMQMQFKTFTSEFTNGSYFRVYLNSSEDASNLSSFTTSTTNDPNMIIGNTVFNASGSALNANSNLLLTTSLDIPFFVSPDISQVYKTFTNRSLSVVFDFAFTRSSSTIDLLIAPIKIKYRW